MDCHAINFVFPWSRWARAHLSMQAFPVAKGCGELVFCANHGSFRESERDDLEALGRFMSYVVFALI